MIKTNKTLADYVPYRSHGKGKVEFPLFVDQCVNDPLNIMGSLKGIQTKKLIQEAYGKIPHHHSTIDNNDIVTCGDIIDLPSKKGN